MIDRVARIFTAYVPGAVSESWLLLSMPPCRSGIGDSRGHPPGLWRSWGICFSCRTILRFRSYAGRSAMRCMSAPTIRPNRSGRSLSSSGSMSCSGWHSSDCSTSERLSRLLSAILCVVAVPVVIWNAAAGGGNGLTLVWLIGAAAGICVVHRLVQEPASGADRLCCGGGSADLPAWPRRQARLEFSGYRLHRF